MTSLPAESRVDPPAPTRGRRGPSTEGPANYRARQYIEIAAFLVIIAVAIPSMALGNYAANLVNLWLIYSLAAVGFYLYFGLAGQFAFSQAFMMAFGAFLSARLATVMPFGVAFLAALGIGVVLSIAFALVARKTNHFQFAIATFGLSELGIIVIRGWPTLGGASGQLFSVSPIEFFGRPLRSQSEVFWILLAALGAGLVMLALIERSPIRRESLALKSNEVVAATVGVPILKHRLVTFVVGSSFAIAAGSLYAHWQGVLSTASFGLDLGTGIFLMVVLGGAGSKWGAIIGAAFYVFVPQWLSVAVQYRTILYGVLLVVIMVVAPKGLIGIASGVWRQVRSRLGGIGTAGPGPSV